MMSTSNSILITFALAMALTITAPCIASSTTPVAAASALRTRKCSTYCFVGNTGKVRQKCGSHGTITCTRKASKGRRSRLLKGLKCNCSKKQTPSASSEPDPVPSSEAPKPPSTPDDLPEADREVTVSCGTTVVSGAEAITKATVNLGRSSGTISIKYQHYYIKDRIRVVYEEKVVYDSGLVGDSKTVGIPFNGAESFMEVYVNGPPNRTAWNFNLGCP